LSHRRRADARISIIVTDEAIHQWCLEFGQSYTHQ
jgi:hypothetical protein